jgi:hypothetical protein
MGITKEDSASENPLIQNGSKSQLLSHLWQTPDDSNIAVFNNWSSKGLIASIPIGGHWAPNSTVGDNALKF